MTSEHEAECACHYAGLINGVETTVYGPTEQVARDRFDAAKLAAPTEPVPNDFNSAIKDEHKPSRGLPPWPKRFRGCG